MGTIVKNPIGAEDVNFKTSGTTRQTFTRADSTGRILTLNQIDAADLQFRTVALQVDDLVDAGYDVEIKPKSIHGGANNTTGHVVPDVADDVFVLLAATQTVDAKTFTNAILNSPTIASFVNATHSHQSAAGGGVLAAPGITSFANATHDHADAAGGGNLTAPTINTSISGTAVLDEDDMASDSATQIATQQSIKAYVDISRIANGKTATTNLAVSGDVKNGDVLLVSLSVEIVQSSNDSEGEIQVKFTGTSTATFHNGLATQEQSWKTDNAVRGINPYAVTITGILFVTASGTLNLSTASFAFGTSPSVTTIGFSYQFLNRT